MRARARRVTVAGRVARAYGSTAACVLAPAGTDWRAAAGAAPGPDVTSRMRAAAYLMAPLAETLMPPFSPETVRRAQAGDAAARDALLTACQPLMRSFFTSRIGHVPEVDDLTQNALLRVHRGLDVLQDPDRAKALAMKAALFELQDHYRGRYSARETLYDPDLPAPGSVEPDDVALQMDLAPRPRGPLGPRPAHPRAPRTRLPLPRHRRDARHVRGRGQDAGQARLRETARRPRRSRRHPPSPLSLR